MPCNLILQFYMAWIFLSKSYALYFNPIFSYFTFQYLNSENYPRSLYPTWPAARSWPSFLVKLWCDISKSIMWGNRPKISLLCLVDRKEIERKQSQSGVLWITLGLQTIPSDKVFADKCCWLLPSKTVSINNKYFCLEIIYVFILMLQSQTAAPHQRRKRETAPWECTPRIA